MGAGAGKLLPYLVVGPQEKEDKLKKAKIDRILTSGSLPPTQNLVWRQLLLNKDNAQFTMQNLLEGAQFIHKSRTDKKNTLVVIQEKDPDSVAFASAYLMAISGLSPETSSLAVSRVLKEYDYKFTGHYDPALRGLRSAYGPKELRAAVINKAGDYSSSQLTDDVCKIYEMAGLVKPTAEQINLEQAIDETKRMSLVGGGSSANDENRKSSKDMGPVDSNSMAKAAGILSEELEASKKSESKHSVTAGLKKIIGGSSNKDGSHEEPMSKEMINSLLAVKNEKEKADLPKILGSVKKRGEIYPAISYYIKPDEFDDYSLTDLRSHSIVGNAQSDNLSRPEGIKDAQPTISKPDEIKDAAEKKIEDSTKKPESKDRPKAKNLYDQFVQRLTKDIEFDDDAFTEVGMVSDKKQDLGSWETSTKREETGKTPDSSMQMNGSIDSSNTVPGGGRYKITIIRAYTRERDDSIAHIDEYLRSLTDEERERNRKSVIIYRAFSRDAYRLAE